MVSSFIVISLSITKDESFDYKGEMMMKKRARAWGLPLEGQPGTYNAITDVSGVEVGMTTLIDPAKKMQTGVTAILPRGRDHLLTPVWAGVHSFNGNGEMTGTHWIRDGGYFMSPIVLTNSHGVGVAHDAVTRWMIERDRDVYEREHVWAMPVVAETYDGVCNDILAMHVTREDVEEALNRASSGPVAEGNVGGGTGMMTYEYKGGSGTSSRIVQVSGNTYTVGVFVQSNFGRRPWLTVCGVPIGRQFPVEPFREADQGSIVAIIATDAPLYPRQLEKLARRATLGIGRTGTVGGNGSGDLFLAFSTANERDTPQVGQTLETLTFINDEKLDRLYEGVVQATEEAVLHAMLMADPVTAVKPEGMVVETLPGERVSSIVKRVYEKGEEGY